MKSIKEIVQKLKKLPGPWSPVALAKLKLTIDRLEEHQRDSSRASTESDPVATAILLAKADRVRSAIAHHLGRKPSLDDEQDEDEAVLDNPLLNEEPTPEVDDALVAASADELGEPFVDDALLRDVLSYLRDQQEE